MNYSGNVFVFDFDDTLMWATDWYHGITLDEEDNVIEPGNSRVLKASLDLIEKLSTRRGVPDNLKNIKIRKDVFPQPDSRDIFFILLDGNDQPMFMEDLRPYASSKELKEANIKDKSRYGPYAAITSDNEYYRILDTVGDLGINKEIMSHYRERAGNAVILTARADVPGMKQRISEVLKEKSGYAPRHVYAQPLKSSDSGVFKAEVLLDIASRDDVKSVQFYEDNLKYIKTIVNFLFLEKFKSGKSQEIVDKINIHRVDVSNKPETKFIKS